MMNIVVYIVSAVYSVHVQVGLAFCGDKCHVMPDWSPHGMGHAHSLWYVLCMVAWHGLQLGDAS